MNLSVKEVKLIECPYDGLIGRGNSEVFKCLVDGEVKALKLLEHSGSREDIEKVKGDRRNEVVGMIKAEPSPYVVHLTGLVEYQYYSGIIMEYLPRGNLSGFLEVYSPSLSLRLKFLRDIAEGISYLHHQISNYEAVSHNDLKPHNIVISEDLRAIICDLASSDVISRTSGIANRKIQRLISCYTVNYAPPELTSAVWTEGQGTKIKRSRAMDVFSFSMIMYFMLTGKHPFGNFESNLVMCKFMNRDRPSVPPVHDSYESEIESQLRQKVEALMKECWDQSPDKRPSMENVLLKLKTFMTEIDQDRLHDEIRSLKRKHPTPKDDHEKYRVTFDTFCEQRMRRTFQDDEELVERMEEELRETELPGASCKATTADSASVATSVVMIQVRQLNVTDPQIGDDVIIKSPNKMITCNIVRVENISSIN